MKSFGSEFKEIPQRDSSKPSVSIAEYGDGGWEKVSRKKEGIIIGNDHKYDSSFDHGDRYALLFSQSGRELL